MSTSAALRRLQRRANGGAMKVTLSESGDTFRAVIYPTRGEASDTVHDRLKEGGVTSVSLDELAALVDKEQATPLFEASGSTFEEALSLLGKEVAEDDKAA